ncbi:hypothetical protein JYU34_000417 [Plutella xylostella]|uniref:Deltamethrin resistance protein prag01 domain-containing protein n=1 Tax=Plutella xylostella TaxID=51655 RepID=A0ABQ7R7R4_PLUXY|nr:hypothetical protein JYU34_000417 [Plutella xylostella]
MAARPEPVLIVVWSTCSARGLACHSPGLAPRRRLPPSSPPPPPRKAAADWTGAFPLHPEEIRNLKNWGTNKYIIIVIGMLAIL